jgi:hypothetical protein
MMSRGDDIFFLVRMSVRIAEVMHQIVNILAPGQKSRLLVESATGIQLIQHQQLSVTTLSPQVLKASLDHYLLRIKERNTSVNKIIILRLPYGILPAIIRLDGNPDACTRASRPAA